MNKQSESFVFMAAYALAGAGLGLISGLLFGLIIQSLSGMLIAEFNDPNGPGMIAPFFGMGFGTLVGAVLGGLSGLKR